MEQKLEALFEKKPAAALSHLSSLTIRNVRFYRSGRRISIDLHSPRPMAFQDYSGLRDYITEACGCPVDLSITCETQTISLGDLQMYIDFLLKEDPELTPLHGGSLRYEEAQNTLYFVFAEEQEAQAASAYETEIRSFFRKVGFPDLKPSFDVREPERFSVDTVIRKEEPEEKTAPEAKPKKRYVSPKRKDWPEVTLKEVTDPIDNIRFTGEIFAGEEIVTRLGKKIRTFSVYDGTDAISVKAFEGRNFTAEELDAIRIGIPFTHLLFLTPMQEILSRMRCRWMKKKRIRLQIRQKKSGWSCICIPICRRWTVYVHRLRSLNMPSILVMKVSVLPIMRMCRVSSKHSMPQKGL